MPAMRLHAGEVVSENRTLPNRQMVTLETAVLWLWMVAIGSAILALFEWLRRRSE